MQYNIVNCSYENHGDRILDILNDAIVHSTALYDYQPRTTENIMTWFGYKNQNNYPVIGLEDSNGLLMGFGSYGPFRNFPAYKYTVEHSIYIHKDYRGLGLGHILLELIIESAKKNNYHILMGAIDADNMASTKLHEKHGFTHVGTLPEVGFKFGRWLNLAFYQRILETPKNPTDG